MRQEIVTLFRKLSIHKDGRLAPLSTILWGSECQFLLRVEEVRQKS